MDILLVDDSEDDFTICTYRLRKVARGTFNFTWADSANAAKEYLSRKKYDCIICDYQMPEEDGLSFLRWLRKRDQITPLVFFTGQGSEQIAAQALKDGANDYFTKNQEFAQFERLANSIFSSVRTSRRARSFKQVENAITRIESETLYLSGEDYLSKLAELLCSELDIAHCFVGGVSRDGTHVETTVLFLDGCKQPNRSVTLAKTPCEDVLKNLHTTIQAGLPSSYPESHFIRDLNAQSYVGVSLLDSSAKAIGVISVLDTQPLEQPGILRSLLTTLSARASVELQRIQSEEALLIDKSFLNSILQDQTDAIVRFKLDGRRTFANRAYCSLMGWSEDEIAGTNVFDDLSETSRIALKKRIDSLTPEEPVVYTLRKFTKKDGDIRYIEWTDRALFDDAGTKEEIQSVGRDVTDRIEATRQSNKLETYFGTLFNSAGDAIFTMKDQVFIDCNPKAQEMFKLSRKEFFGTSPVEVSPEYQYDGTPSRVKALFYMNKALEGPVSFNWRHKNRAGEEFDAQVTLSSMEVDGDIFLLAIVRNLTELKETLLES